MQAAPGDDVARSGGLAGAAGAALPPPVVPDLSEFDHDQPLSTPQVLGYALLICTALATWPFAHDPMITIPWLVDGLCGFTIGCALAGFLLDGVRRDPRCWLWTVPAVGALAPWWGMSGLTVVAVAAGSALWLGRRASGRSWLGLALLGTMAGAGLASWQPLGFASQAGRFVAALGIAIALAGRIRQALSARSDDTARIALLESERGTDDETGLPGLRRFQHTLTAEWLRARRDLSTVSLILVEFPPVASVQQEFATAVGLAARRTSDIAARLDQHSYALLLPNTSRDGALTVITALKANLLELVGDVPIRLGIASAQPAELAELRPEDLLTQAQANLADQAAAPAT